MNRIQKGILLGILGASLFGGIAFADEGSTDTTGTPAAAETPATTDTSPTEGGGT